MTDTTTEAVLPETLTDDQRRAVWLAQYRIAAARCQQPPPDSTCLALANEKVSSDNQRESDLAAWRALRETLLPGARALAQERDAAFQRGMLHACDIACDVMQRAAKCAREPDLIPNIRREFLAQARGVEDAIDAIRRASEGGKNA